MKNIKTFEYYNDATNLMTQFISWLSDKLGVKIGEYIGGGVEGQIYSIDKHKVIKLSYSDVAGEQYLSSRNIEGIVKIYQTGVIEAPKRFKYPEKSDYYKGIHLLNHERTESDRDTKIGYIIIERLYPSDKLEKDLKYLDSKMWYDGFAKGDFETILDEKTGLNKRVYIVNEPNNYHKDTLDIIKDSYLRGFGRFFLKNIFMHISNNNFINDSREYIAKNENKKYLKIFERLVTIAKNVDKLNLDWDDIHPQQFAYNSKKEITALDVRFGLPKYTRSEGGEYIKIVNKTKDDAYKKKVKNVIRENKIQKFFEYSEAESVEKGITNRDLLGGRSKVLDMNDINEVLEKYASWYNPNESTPLYRGLNKYGSERTDDFLLIDPSEHNRTSIDNDNYYNLIIDNDSKWSEYPKRAKSIIGSTNYKKVRAYGVVYRVIPLFEYSKIAVAPSFDIWYSFDKSLKSDNPMHTECTSCGGSGTHTNDDTIECGRCFGYGTEEVTNLSDLNRKLKKDFKLDKEDYTWLEFKKKVDTALPKLSEIFDPKINGFHLEKYNNSTKIEDSREFWTDVKCLLIREDLF